MHSYHSWEASLTDSWNHQEEHPTTSTMQRFLLEQSRPFLTSSSEEYADTTVYAFPGDSYDGVNHAHNSLQYSYTVPRRYASPSSSGLGSSGISSSWSDRQGSPWSSPEMSHLPYPMSVSGSHSAELADPPFIPSHDALLGDACVAMNDVQKYADHQTENIAFEDDSIARFGLFGSFAQEGYQEGYQPMSETQDEQMLDTEYNESITPYPSQVQHSPRASPWSESDTPVFRRRRPQPSRAATSPRQTSRVSKRVQLGRRSSDQENIKTFVPTQGHSHRSGSTAFPCALQAYGCTSTFASKNEWKRHVATQHMQLDSWRCGWCPEGRPKDFNRKDLFIQHVRRMHPDAMASLKTSSTRKPGKDTTQEQAAVAAVSERCYRRLRSSPDESRCLLCDVSFHGPGSWEERMEHFGRHLEHAKKGVEKVIDPQDWSTDTSTHEWLIKEEIVLPSGKGFVLADKT